jgi:hypothetical protein
MRQAFVRYGPPGATPPRADDGYGNKNCSVRTRQKNIEGESLKNGRLVDRFKAFAEVAITLFCAFLAYKLIWLFLQLLNP